MGGNSPRESFRLCALPPSSCGCKDRKKTEKERKIGGMGLLGREERQQPVTVHDRKERP